MRVLILVLAVALGGCVTGGDPRAVVEADLARERLVLQQHELLTGVVNRVENWSPEQREAVLAPAAQWIERYRELAETERDYLEATGAPDWRDVAREVGAVGGELLGGEEVRGGT